MTAPSPTYEDIMSECLALAGRAPGLASFAEIGRSAEGRAIPLLTLSDPAIPADEKNVVLVSGGTDGNEEVGRACALGLARALLEPQHRVHLQRQTVLIVPVTNPDGTAHDLPDVQGNGSGIPAPEVHKPGQPPATAEGRAMRELVEHWIPDAHFDFHGLAGGGMGDSAYLYPTVNEKWSIPVLYEVAREIEAAGERAGYPQEGRPRLWVNPRHNLPGWLARQHSAFCMVLEGTENYYPIEESVRAGLVRLLRLLEIGEETRFFQVHPNYPCDVVSGSRMGALMPYGATYGARRASRRAISQMILEGVPWFGRKPADRGWVAEIALPVEATVKTFPQGLAFQATLDRRATVTQVFWQDHVLEANLWKVWPTSAGLVVRAEVPEAPVHGENALRIRYEVPFKRHVEP
ncbi:MAG: hypothetical protein KIS92_19515 [Planctomycetota bacterium]|nr:hypothetical protein [Planctomycetota bacterium]